MSRKAWLFWPLVAAIVFGDWASKRAVVASLSPGVPHDVVGNAVRLTLAYNQGAAMGLPLGSHSGQVLGVLGFGVVVALLLWYRRVGPDEILLPLTLALLTAGALGNAWERVFATHGVVDFVDVGAGTLRFWAFNVADASLTCGVVLLVIHFWREDRRVGHDSPAA
jgi:signal peptidase II